MLPMPSRSQQRRGTRLGVAAFLTGFALLACTRDDALPPAALGPVITEPLAVAGRLTLSGGLAKADGGGVVLRLVEQATGRVLLQRTYDLADPLWDRREGSQGVYFALDARDAVAAAAPVHAPLVFEAAYVATRSGVLLRPDDTRVSVALAQPARELELELQSEAIVAGADTPVRDAPR